MKRTAYQDATRKGNPTLRDLRLVLDAFDDEGIPRDTVITNIVLKPYVAPVEAVLGHRQYGAPTPIDKPAVEEKLGRIGIAVAWTS